MEGLKKHNGESIKKKKPPKDYVENARKKYICQTEGRVAAPLSGGGEAGVGDPLHQATRHTGVGLVVILFVVVSFIDRSFTYHKVQA